MIDESIKYYYALTPNNFKRNEVFLINVHNSGFVPKSNVFYETWHSR